MDNSRKGFKFDTRYSGAISTRHPAGALLIALLAFILAAALPRNLAASPYTGSPIAIPGAFEAENFDLGGEGAAYHDSAPGNAGGRYRTGEDVDIIRSTDSLGGAYVVNNFATGEWLAYTVSVAASAPYDIELRVSSAFSSSAFHIEVDGVNVTGSITVPNTSSWNAFQWVGRKAVPLAAGTHVLKIVSDRQYFNLNAVRVTPTPAPTPYSGLPIEVPGNFEAENYDRGGEAIAYHDLAKGNAGGQYRTSEDVDIVASTDTLGGGYVVNNFQTGEWLAYTVNVAATTQYDIEVRASSALAGSAFHVEVDGVNATGSITVPDTGSWNAFQWVGRKGVPLTAGRHLLKIVSDQQYFNLNSVRVTANPVPVPYSGNPVVVPGTFEAENFDGGGEGAAYHDNVKGNSGGQYRAGEDVDIVVSTDTLGGGYVVNNFETGEWLLYTINVPAAAQYDIEIRASSELSNSAFHVEIDGVDVTGSIAVPNTGSWNAFQWAGKKAVPLGAGTHLLKIVSDQQYFNLNSVRVLASAPAPIDPATIAFSCTFASSPTNCGFMEQAKVAGRASIAGAGRDGVTGLRLHTEPGDNNVSGSGAMERNDLWLSQAASDGYQGREHWWAHSIMLPDDFAMPTWQMYVLFDFHHTGSTGGANFHILFDNGVLSFRGYGGQNVNEGYYQAAIGPAVKNAWYDFVYHVKWSSGNDGFFRAWVNGVKKLDHSGPTMYAGQGVYLKLANYHTPVCNPYPGCTGPASSVIHDRVIRGTMPLAVSLGPLEGVLDLVNGILMPLQ